jgi:NAD(P)-dependent dehydrogenase (short-subunit alcohol dehydrogenase family)
MKNNLFDLQGKVAIVTGGYGALGRSMATYLAKQGVKIAILGHRAESVEKCVAEMQATGIEVLPLVASVTDQQQLEQAKEALLGKWGKIDILLNAAGGNMPGATISPGKTIFDLSFPDYQKVLDLNLNGTVLPTLVFGEIMATQKSGAIINVSSMAAMRTITRVVGYSSAKAAVDNFTRWMAVEMATKFGEGIRVNAIAPGFFIGDQNRALLTNPDGSLTERGKQIISLTPMKRFGESHELNGAIHWLCSDAASFVTGVIVPIDGGFSSFSGV